MLLCLHSKEANAQMDYSNKAAFVLFRDCVFPSSSLVHAGFPYGRTGEGPAENRGFSPGTGRFPMLVNQIQTYL